MFLRKVGLHGVTSQKTVDTLHNHRCKNLKTNEKGYPLGTKSCRHIGEWRYSSVCS
jgi:hypothetical protein